MALKQELCISNKIVGRDEEIELLQAIYRSVRDRKPPDDMNNSTHSVSLKPTKSAYIKGLSGTGKSALVTAALKEVVTEDGGFFCEGKFDSMSSHRPFSAVVDALDSLCSKALGGITDETKREELRFKIQSILGEDEASALTSLLPTMKTFLKVDHQLMEDTSQSSALSAGALLRRTHQALKHSFFKLKEIVRNLVQLMVEDKPLVLFIDDLQWANIESLELMDDLVATIAPTKLFLVGGFRSDEVSDDHYLSVQLREEEQTESTTATSSSLRTLMEISELKLQDVACLLADTLHEEEETIMPLAKLVYETTKGNSFSVRQYIEYLHKNGNVFYSLQTFRWEWEDVMTIRNASPIENNDIGAIVQKKILQLPEQTIESLKLASCIGGRFDLDVVVYLSQRWVKDSKVMEQAATRPLEQKAVEDALWEAVDEGLIEEIRGDPFADAFAASTSIQYKFTHDKVQAAAYGLIGEAKEHYHLSVGTYLRDLFRSGSGQVWMVILAAEHICKGKSLLSSQEQKDDAAELCHFASQELQANSAFLVASTCLRNAIAFLGDDGWSRKYDLSLKVYNARVEMTYCCGAQEECEQSVQAILSKARSLDDKHTAYYVWMTNLSSLRRHDEALEMGLALLKNLNFCKIPSKLSISALLIQMMSTLRAVKKVPSHVLLKKEITERKDVEAFVNALMSSSIFALFAGKVLDFLYLSMKALKISLQYGYSPCTPAAFTVGAMVCAKLGKYKEADRLGKVALELSKWFEESVTDSFDMLIYYGSAHHLFNPYTELPDSYGGISTLALKRGNLTIACSAGVARVGATWFVGSLRLDKLIAMAAKYRNEQIAFKKETFLPATKMFRQLALNVAGRSINPAVLEGEEIKNLAELRKGFEGDAMAQKGFVVASLQLAYLFGDLDTAHDFALQSAKSWSQDKQSHLAMFLPLYRGLIWCALYKRDEVAAYARNAKKELKIFKQWNKAGLASRMCLGLLLEAEVMTISAKISREQVKAAFDKAIIELDQFGFNHFAAMGAERAAAYFSGVNDEMATEYLGRAIEGYTEWRAHGKVTYLREQFPRLLDNR